ncbi:MAG: cytochrome ubiquinol oxidase subunit I [Candidatus Gracilibacteria bacterium]|nr:cytochrome ubiquinol oxidase subunit I [Candidatus Gracilibacteria bacterium]
MFEFLSLVDWSRAQFALTAGFHWIFVPFTLGITYIIATMETIYFVTGSEMWKKITQFWTKIFAVNFAVGVATGIILEFEFGTNWSNYSWFVGDIFGAPLVIEGLAAFFLETTFLAVMLLGWDKVSKRFHLASAWIVAFGGSFSAVWILIANGWMQHPTGMVFNPDTLRNEMINMWGVVSNPVALTKLFHALSSAITLSSVVVIGISSWYLLKGREKEFAYKTIALVSIFGAVASIMNIIAGDLAGKDMAKYQPMKVAAVEGLYEGGTHAGFAPFAFFGEQKADGTRDVLWEMKFPGVLSWLLFGDTNAYVPGIKNLLEGDPAHGIVSAPERIRNGKIAIEALKQYKEYSKNGDTISAQIALNEYKKYEKDFGYGYFDENNLGELVPNVPFLFWSFRYMVGLGFFIALFFPLMWWLAHKRTLEKYRFLLLFAIILIPFVYISSELGWAVAEVGRQPWIVYEVLPTKAAISATSTTNVALIFIGFFLIFTTLFIAAFRIALNQIKVGPKIAEKATKDDNEDEDETAQKESIQPAPAKRKAPVKKPVPRKPAVKKVEETTEKPAPRKRAPKKQAE